MKRPSILALLAVAGLLLLLPAGLQAQSIDCGDPVSISADGRVITDFIGTGVTAWYEFVALQNASYVFDVNFFDEETVSPDIEVFKQADFNTGTCTGTAAAGRVFRQTTDPAYVGGSEGTRIAWIADTTTTYVLMVHNPGAIGGSVGISLTETSLFSPRWSTFGGFYTTWGFFNTTRTNLSVTLRLVESGSNCLTAALPLATTTFTVNAGQVVFRDTRPGDLNIAASKAGAACVSHNGPPGAIAVDGFMTNENGAVFVTIPVRFETTRQIH